jgi:drug/metabolite transporter (DMT)-like permease
MGAWARLLLLGLVWGGSFIGTAAALESFGPMTVAAARLTLAAGCLLIWARLRGALPPRLSDRRIWAFALAVAVLSNAAPFALLSWAQQHVPANLAAVFMAFLPLMVLPMSHFLTPGERMTPRKLAGFALGTVGAVVLIGPAPLADLGGGGAKLLAEAACFGVMAFYACGSIAAKRAPSCDSVAFGAMVLTLAAAMVAPAALLLERPFAHAPGWRSVGGVLWLGLLSTGLAQVLLLEVLRRAGPPFLSMVNFMIPIWAMIFGATLLGEKVEPRALAALALTFGGVAVAQGLTAALDAARPHGLITQTCMQAGRAQR